MVRMYKLGILTLALFVTGELTLETKRVDTNIVFSSIHQQQLPLLDYPWEGFPLEDSVFINDIEMLSTTNAWAVGDKEDGTGLILHWDGIEWTSIQNPAPSGLNAVDFVSPSDGWAVGTCNIIVHWDGNKWDLWQDIQCSGAYRQSLTDVSMLSSNFGWAVGSGNQASGGVSYKWNGVSWEKYDIVNYPESVSTVSESSAWTAPYSLLEWDGSKWVNHGDILGVRSVWVTELDGWAVGEGIYRWTGLRWIAFPFPSQYRLGRLVMTTVEGGWLVEQHPVGSAIWLWNGVEWSRLACFPDTQTTKLGTLSNFANDQAWISTYSYTQDGLLQSKLYRLNLGENTPIGCDGFNNDLFEISQINLPSNIQSGEPSTLSVVLTNLGPDELQRINLNIDVDLGRANSFIVDSLLPFEKRTIEIPVLFVSSGQVLITVTGYLSIYEIDAKSIVATVTENAKANAASEAPIEENETESFSSGQESGRDQDSDNQSPFICSGFSPVLVVGFSFIFISKHLSRRKESSL